MLRDQSGGRLGADARDTGEPVGRVADQRKVIRDERRPHAELLPHAFFITHQAALSVHLHHALSNDALRKILVGRPDAHFLHARIRGGQMRGGRKTVIRLQLRHRPRRHAHGDQRFFKRVKLRKQRRIDPFTGLVARPQIVAERLDDVVSGDADVRGAAVNHLRHGAKHAVHGGKGRSFSLSSRRLFP